MSAFVKKFLIKEIPNLSTLTPQIYERYYLYEDDQFFIFIENISGKYIFTRKVVSSDKDSLKFNFSRGEFENFKKFSIKQLVFDLYSTDNNNKRIKVYKDQLEGLVTIEIYFDSIENAQSYKPPTWLGKEITQTPLGNENELLQLSRNTFTDLLNLYKKESHAVSTISSFHTDDRHINRDNSIL